MKGVVIAIALAGLVGGGMDASDAGREQRGEGVRPTWTEIAWPFLFDAWGPGRAFRCPAAECGADLRVYARTKAGFCNCYRGVEDDDEIDRIGDVDLHGDRYVALAPGRADWRRMYRATFRPSAAADGDCANSPFSQALAASAPDTSAS